MCKCYAALEQDKRHCTYDELCHEDLAQERVPSFVPDDKAHDFKQCADAKLLELQEFIGHIEQRLENTADVDDALITVLHGNKTLQRVDVARRVAPEGMFPLLEIHWLSAQAC